MSQFKIFNVHFRIAPQHVNSAQSFFPINRTAFFSHLTCLDEPICGERPHETVTPAQASTSARLRPMATQTSPGRSRRTTARTEPGLQAAGGRACRASGIHSRKRCIGKRARPRSRAVWTRSRLYLAWWWWGGVQRKQLRRQRSSTRRSPCHKRNSE